MFEFSASRNDSILRLFCIPNAGKGRSAFRGWAEEFLPDIETTLVELPGRESRFRETPYREMRPLAGDLSRAVIACLADEQPFAFFGNSLGAAIAFETLHEVRRRTGREAAHLFVSAAGAPRCKPPLPSMAHLSDPELIRTLDERYGGIPAAILADQEFLTAMLPTLRADVGLLEAYRPAGDDPLHCPITAFAGTRDATVPREHVEAWREQTTNAFQCLFLDEGHLYLQSARDILVRHVRQALVAVAIGDGESR